MEEPLLIKALQDKRAEIHGRITAYEAQIEQAKHDPAHVNATLRLFTDVEKQRARYVVSHGFFRKGEIADLCVLQLQEASELTTRALAERVMRARDLDARGSAPGQDRHAGQFRPVVGKACLRPATPRDNAIKLTGHALPRQRGVRHQCQALARAIIDHKETIKFATSRMF